MRSRDRVLQSLENVYRTAFSAAEASGDTVRMETLDMDYQRDQLQLEILLDIRELLQPEPEDLADRTSSLLEKAHDRAPEKPALQLHLARAYTEAGRTDDARRLLLDLRPRTGDQPQLRTQVDEAIAQLP